MTQLWRLINHGPGEPAWNMAVDEALVTVFSKGGVQPALRLYTWEPPALSLGYFQKADSVQPDVLGRLGIMAVRRVTGGRAVLHYGDLTYSIVARGRKRHPGRVFRFLPLPLLRVVTRVFNHGNRSLPWV